MPLLQGGGGPPKSLNPQNPKPLNLNYPITAGGPPKVSIANMTKYGVSGSLLGGDTRNDLCDVPGPTSTWFRVLDLGLRV